MCENTHGDLILWSRSIYTANEAVTNGVVHYIYEHLIKPSVNFSFMGSNHHAGYGENHGTPVTLQV